MTDRQVLQLIERKRAQHPELRQRPSWSDILRVLEREGVQLRRARLPKGVHARLTQIGRVWTVLLSDLLPPARRLSYVVHELGHLWLHIDTPGIDRWEVVYNARDEWPAEQEEDDVEFLVTCILHEVRLEL